MKFDLHTHTYYSDDAATSPEDMVIAAKQKGMDGIAVTDHNMIKAWKRSIAAGKKHGVMIIKAEEIKVFHDGRKLGEVIALFLNEEIKPGEVGEVKDKIKAQGGIMVVAHPFDKFRNNFKDIDAHKKHFDGVEAFNARVITTRFNDKARAFAEKNGFGVTGGSDGHCRLEIGNAYTVADITRTEDLAKAIKSRKTQAFGKKTNPLIHTLSTMAKLGLLKTPKD